MFANMRVVTRLGIGFGLMILMLLGSSMFGLDRLRSVSDLSARVMDVHYPRASLSRDIIVNQHGGTIEVETVPGSFTEFRIVLPRKAAPPMSQADGGNTDQSS